MYLVNPSLVFILELVWLLDFGINSDDLIARGLQFNRILHRVLIRGLEADELRGLSRVFEVLLHFLFHDPFLFVHFFLVDFELFLQFFLLEWVVEEILVSHILFEFDHRCDRSNHRRIHHICRIIVI